VHKEHSERASIVHCFVKVLTTHQLFNNAPISFPNVFVFDRNTKTFGKEMFQPVFSRFSSNSLLHYFVTTHSPIWRDWFHKASCGMRGLHGWGERGSHGWGERGLHGWGERGLHGWGGGTSFGRLSCLRVVWEWVVGWTGDGEDRLYDHELRWSSCQNNHPACLMWQTS